VQYGDHFNTVTIRCPTIIDEGRLGLLSIIFEFIREGRKLWVVGDGSNRYQFIYAQELIGAMVAGVQHGRSEIFGIGSDDVRPLREVYEYVIREPGSSSRVASIPTTPAAAGMKLAYHLRISPLGPYHSG
jgi:nucleoside-diphosphate-sugar epimerase